LSRYKLYITSEAFEGIRYLPGNMRQRVRRAIRELADDPRPSQSKALTLTGFDQELRRLRLDRWRIVYIIDEDHKTVDVLALRKRPPYDYGDLESLLQT
jgi:mRNA interferase RelE/StbE